MGLGDGTGVVVAMDYQVLFNIAIALTTFLGGWVVNTITTNIKEIGVSVKALEQAHARTREEYVTKAEHKSDLDNLTHRFDRIDDKLDSISKDLAHKA